MRSLITRRKVLGLLAGGTLFSSSVRRLVSAVTTTIEPRVPRFHVNAATGRINDPQRPLWINDSWHLWILWNSDFPHHRGGTVWLHFSSIDLVHWSQRGTSIPKDTTPYGDVWTGSSVIDRHNSAGFGRGTVLALMTMPCKPLGGQGTARWYSHDGGSSFRFDSVVMTNPRAKDQSLKDKVFRDPSVFWHEPTQSWVMSLAEPGQIGFYRSSDLKSWKSSGAFQNAGLGTLECPNLFALPLHGKDGTTVSEKWVLWCGANGTASGFTTGTHYWLGTFDGHRFEPDEADGAWLDGGPDFYAATAFGGGSANLLEPTFAVAWMNNWNYADAVQEQGYIGQLSLVRELRLQLVDGKPTLQNRPIDAASSLFETSIRGKDQIVSAGQEYVWPDGAAQACCRIDFTLSSVRNSWPEAINLSLRGGGDYMTHLEFNPAARNMLLDRGRCGPIPKEGDAWKTRRSVQCNFASSLSVSIFLDVGSIEVFLNDGAPTMSALLTAPLDATALQLTVIGGQVGVSSVKISK